MLRPCRRVPIATLICLLGIVFPGRPQSGAKDGEWRSYGGDLGSTRYAPLDQINASNFNRLEVAWRFRTDSLGPRPEYQYEGTPLMIHGKLYVTAGSRRAVVCLDGATGEMLWMHSENEGARAENSPRQLSGHGLAFWTDGREERILYVTTGYRLVALDAKTGYPVRTFGSNGIVDLKQDDDQEIDLVTGDLGLHSTPIVAKNVVIVGAAHLNGTYQTAGEATVVNIKLDAKDMPAKDLEAFLPALGINLPKGASIQGGMLNTDFLDDFYRGHVRPGGAGQPQNRVLRKNFGIKPRDEIALPIFVPSPHLPHLDAFHCHSK